MNIIIYFKKLIIVHVRLQKICVRDESESEEEVWNKSRERYELSEENIIYMQGKNEHHNTNTHICNIRNEYDCMHIASDT